MIKFVVFDIDGVLTDGCYLIDNNGNELKKINFKDLDYFTNLKKLNVETIFLTGEKNKISEYFNKKFKPNYFMDGVSDKYKVLNDFCINHNISFDDICYVGDGKKDLECMKKSKISIAPCNAIKDIKEIATHNLDIQGGAGVVSFVYDIIDKYNNKYEKQDDYNVTFDDHISILKKMLNDDNLKTKINLVIDIMIETLKNKNTIFACGNGGSASDSEHFVSELVGRFRFDRQSLNAISLTTNSSVITAIGNDYSYEEIFKRQIQGLGKNNDVLLAITTSGNSKNIKLAIDEAIKLKMKVILLTSDMCNYQDNDNLIIVKIPSNNTPRIQEIHIMIIHYICEKIEKYILRREYEK